MTTPTRCDTEDHQFLVQDARTDVMLLEIGYLSSELGPSGLPGYNCLGRGNANCRCQAYDVSNMSGMAYREYILRCTFTEVSRTCCFNSCNAAAAFFDIVQPVCRFFSTSPRIGRS